MKTFKQFKNIHKDVLGQNDTRKWKPLQDGTDELVKKYDNNPINLLASLSSRAAPVPVSIGNAKQRKREGSDVNTEDAKAFVNFLQSVAHE